MAPSVHRLHLGTVTLSAQFNPLTNVDARIEVYAYLIVAESHILLVDTGVGEGNAYIDQTFEPRRAAVAQELARFGVSTSDVSVLINSHLHFDHCGNNRSFPEAEVLVQAEELSIARTTR
ncbi:MAG: MBL fold metallo-hydrolase [Gammaproteobacteria bacterium]